MIAPLPRLWEVVVNGNEITIIKLFIFKKKFYISDISFCIVKKGELFPVKSQGRCFILIEEQLIQKQREILDNTDAGYFVAKREG